MVDGKLPVLLSLTISVPYRYFRIEIIAFQRHWENRGCDKNINQALQ